MPPFAKTSRRDILSYGAAAPLLGGLLAEGARAQRAAARGVPEARSDTPIRERLLLDFDWKFHFGHADDPAKDFGFGYGRSGGFQKTGNFLVPSHIVYDDSGWSPVDLPHDWALGLPFTNGPELTRKGSYPLGRNYPETSVGWYRRVFELPASDAGRRVSLEFDGVYRDAMIVFNGFYIGRHGGGYDPFRYDVTDFMRPGEPNVLLIRVDATLSDGWFYEGAGIYRHVWLVKTPPVHVRQWGAFVRADVQPDGAHLTIETEIENHAGSDRPVRVTSVILDPAGREVGRTTSDPVRVPHGGEAPVRQQVTVARPALWSLEERNLHRLVTELEVDGVAGDRQENRFGIRTIRFDAERGFFLNGTSVKIKGTCNHQSHAGLGAALPDAAQVFRIKTLKDMGCNAYRTSHNPPTPELLDACDELGMLVLDETRMMSSNPEALAQFGNMIRRDRNRPSIILWSMGNEERESATQAGLAMLTSMKEYALNLDPSRPITIASPPGGLTLGHGGLAVVDVTGYNYADKQVEAYHATHPTMPVIGTETVSAVGTRGFYAIDPRRGFVSSYDPYTTTGRASAEGWWRFANSRPWVSGGFVWTGFDYGGEPSPYGWPNVGSAYGIMDTCGFPKDSYYYYQAWWTDRPVLHLFPHWNWPGLEGKSIAVWVHSNMDEVELLVNGRSLGRKPVPRDSHVAWDVVYAPGSIVARGYKAGRLAQTTRRDTVGAPARLGLAVDRRVLAADGEDVAFFTVSVLDRSGRVVPLADDAVDFAVRGAGYLKGVGNGDPTSHESDIGNTRKAFAGLCQVIVQAGKTAGPITLDASAPGLAPASLRIAAFPKRLRPQVAGWRREVPRGEGVTGFWRATSDRLMPAVVDALQLGDVGSDMVFTFRQNGAALTGRIEAPPAGFANGAGGPVQDGRVDSDRITFRAADASFEGRIFADRIELVRMPPPPPLGSTASPAAVGGPVVGPPPAGTDPSFGMKPRPGPLPMTLRRASH